MNISSMKKEDVNSVALLEKECFASPWTEKTLLEETENPTSVFLVAKVDGKTVGYIGANDILGEVFITNVAVLNDYRKQGVATALIKELINICRKNNASYLTLEVRKSNIAAINLYKKLGFSVVGERADFYSNPTENALLYSLYF